MAFLSRRSVLLSGMGLGVAACSRNKEPLISQETAAAGAGPEMVALKEILGRRVKAVHAADEGLFLADLDQSNVALIKQQKMLLANLRQFKFAAFNYVVPQLAGVRVDNGVVTCQVVGIVQLAIDDAGTGVLPGEAFQYTLVRDGDRFVVKDIVGKTSGNAGALGIDGPLADAPWNTTALKVTTVGNVWLASDASVTDLDRYVGAAGVEAQRVDDLWGSRLRYPGSLLFLTRDTEAFKAWYGFGAAKNYGDTVEGIAPSRVGVRANGEVYRDQFAGSRVVVNLKRVDAVNDDPKRVIRHELAHGITARGREVGAGFTDLYSGAPLWAVEGFAAWTETLDNPQLAARYRRDADTGFNGKLPHSPDFYAGNITANYAKGAAVFLYAQQLKGVQAAVELYASAIAHSDFGSEAVAELPVFDGICKRIFGLSSPAFTSQWANFVASGG